MLAELGHLRPGDLLWRPGFGDWKSVESIPGLLTPPPPPKTASAPKKKAKKKREVIADTPPPLPPQKQSESSGGNAAGEFDRVSTVLSDDVPQFLLGLVAKPAARASSDGATETVTDPASSTNSSGSASAGDTIPTKPTPSTSSRRAASPTESTGPMRQWIVVAKDRLSAVDLGSRLGDFGTTIAALSSQEIVHRMKRPRVLMGIVGGLILIGALNVIAKPFLGDEEYALRSSSLDSDPAEGVDPNRKSKFQDRYAHVEPPSDKPPTVLSERTARENGGPPTGSIDLDPEFLRPKTVPRPGAAERAATGASEKPDAELPSKPTTTASPSKPQATKAAPSPSDPAKPASNSPSTPASPTTASAQPSKSISPVFASKAPGPSKTVINVATPKGIRLVQMRLSELGYLSMSPNGVWTAETTKALEAFMAKARLGEYQNWNSTVERALFATEAPRVTASAEPRP